MSSELVGRVYKHKNKLIEGHTSKYGIDRLVYFESTTDVHVALNREKQLKKWNRAWKIELIEKANPDWKDLYDDII
jgi:putative endonuclease